MMELFAVAPRITLLRPVMMVTVQILEFVTRLIAVRMLPVKVRSRENHVVLVEYVILVASV
jgi:hypothetical protein